MPVKAGARDMNIAADKHVKTTGPRRVSHATILLAIVALAVLFCLTVSILIDSGDEGQAEFPITATFALNGLLGVVMLCKSIADRPFSLVQIHWMFYLTMFVVAPYSQYLYDYSPWGFALSSDDYFITNCVLLLWGCLFAFFSNCGGALKDLGSQKSFYDSLPKINGGVATRVFVFSLIATVVVVGLIGFENLFSRDTASVDLDKTAGILFNSCFRPMPVFAFVLLLARAKQQRKLSPTLVVSFVFVILACFPTGMARYNMAFIYGGILILACGPLFEKKGLFPLLLLLGFLIVFPAANAYRHDDFTLAMFGDALVDALVNLPSGFCTADYDAYSIVARTLRYVNEFGPANGYQLLGVLLFFVPRVIWPEKPVGSGSLIASAQGQSFVNISSPLPAEGVVNFGVVGLILFAVFAAVACRFLDKRFGDSSSVFRLFYPFACLLFFFMMRGDLLSSFAYSVGGLVSFAVVCLIGMGPKAVFSRKAALDEKETLSVADEKKDARRLPGRFN